MGVVRLAVLMVVMDFVVLVIDVRLVMLVSDRFRAVRAGAKTGWGPRTNS